MSVQSSCTLPICDIPRQDIKTFKSDQYEELKKLISDYVSADCHAFVVDNEVLFNSYLDKTFSQSIQEDLIRDKIIEDPHSSVLVHLHRSGKPTRINIYMFSEHMAYRYEVNFNPNISDRFTVQRFDSDYWGKK